MIANDKIYAILLLLLTAFLPSCSVLQTVDLDTNPPADTIVGMWKPEMDLTLDNGVTVFGPILFHADGTGVIRTRHSGTDVWDNKPLTWRHDRGQWHVELPSGPCVFQVGKSLANHQGRRKLYLFTTIGAVEYEPLL